MALKEREHLVRGKQAFYHSKMEWTTASLNTTPAREVPSDSSKGPSVNESRVSTPLGTTLEEVLRKYVDLSCRAKICNS